MLRTAQSMRRLLALLVQEQRGITGLETAIVLIAFVVVSSVFAFAALSSGLFASDQAKETIYAGLKETQGAMELRGTVVVEDTDKDGSVDQIIFHVGNAAGGDAVDLTPGVTVVRYTDNSQTVLFDGAGEYTLTVLGDADADNHLEAGEIAQITIPGLEAALTPDLGISTAFSLQVYPPTGAAMFVERATPPSLAKYTDLN